MGTGPRFLIPPHNFFVACINHTLYLWDVSFALTTEGLCLVLRAMRFRHYPGGFRKGWSVIWKTQKPPNIKL